MEVVNERRDRFRGALLGALVGDALGAPFEGHSGPVPAARIHAVMSDGQELRFTDDSAMTIAFAESLLECGDLDQDHLAATFAAHYVREPWRGYGGGTASLLQAIARGEHWSDLAPAQFDGSGSFGNGAAMRVAPAALHVDGDHANVVDLARRSAVVTHAHPSGIDGAIAQAVGVAVALASPATGGGRPLFAQLERALVDITFADRIATIQDHLDGSSPEVVARALGTSVAADEAVPAALWAFVAHADSFHDAVVAAIELGGDTDTIASMAGALAGARLGASAIPEPWVARAEGAAHVVELADRLAVRA